MNNRAFGATALTAVAVAVIFYYQSILNIVLGIIMCSVVFVLVFWLGNIMYEGYSEYFEDRDNRTKTKLCAEEIEQ